MLTINSGSRRSSGNKFLVDAPATANDRRRGGSTLGQGGTCPQIHLLPLPQIQKLADRSDVIYEVSKCSKISNVGVYDVRIFRFRRTEKMDSVMKELMGAMPLPEFFG